MNCPAAWSVHLHSVVAPGIALVLRFGFRVVLQDGRGERLRPLFPSLARWCGRLGVRGLGVERRAPKDVNGLQLQSRGLSIAWSSSLDFDG